MLLLLHICGEIFVADNVYINPCLHQPIPVHDIFFIHIRNRDNSHLYLYPKAIRIQLCI
jgi:hypothetical protein